MKWSLQQLNKYTSSTLNFSTKYTFEEYSSSVNGLISISEVEVTGKARCIGDEKYHFNLHINCLLELEDAWTLEPVPFKVDLDVEEIFDRIESNEDVRIIEKNTIDLYDVVWENILLEIPMRIVKDEAKEVN